MNSAAAVIDQWRSRLLDDDSGFHGQAWREAEKLLQDYDVVVWLPRLVTGQMHENNVPASLAHEYYRVMLCSQCLDHMGV